MNWALLDAIEQQEIENLGWKPVFPSFAYLNGDIGSPITLYGPTGEDFLYMHRKMIKAVNDIAAEVAPPGTTPWEVIGWLECPAPDDANWPLPPVPQTIIDGNAGYAEYLGYYKSDEYFEIIREREAGLTIDYLKSVTLGEFGTKIEYELHTDFHVRFAAYNPVGYRMQNLHPTSYIEPKWDNPEYDYLADFYSAHVNPTFWKIHGWVELQITNWANANNKDRDNLPWTSTWENGPMNAEILTALEKVAADAKERAREPDNYAGEIVGAVLGGVVVMAMVLVAGWLLLSKMVAKSAGYTKAHTHETKA